MNDSDDFTRLDDPAFLAERRRVRGELQRTPENEVSPELAARCQRLDEEFLRRASLAWTQAGQGMSKKYEPAQFTVMDGSLSRGL